MNNFSLFYIAPLALLLSSCMMGPDFEGAPSQNLPATWVNAMPPSTSEGSLETWWKQFNDPQLDRLIATGFANNPDMIKAALAINSAEAALRSTKSSLFPTDSARMGGSNVGNSNSPTSHGQWSGSLSLAWTPDIWGGTRREIQAAVANLGSSTAAAAATRTALASGIATTYFNWIDAKAGLIIVKKQLTYQEKTYEVVKDRVAAGFQSELDLQQALSVILTTRAAIPTLEAAVRNDENALAIYLGTTIDQIKLSMPAHQLLRREPRVPTNLPSDLLRRRPDIVQAEYNIQASCAKVGVAVANLFPSISLTGNASAGSGSDFSDFFTGSTWSLGAAASSNIFNRVALNEAVNMAELSQESSVQNYRKTVLAAFAEVEAELITYAQLVEQLPQYEASAEANKKAAELSLRLYNTGNADFLNVATAEKAWLSAELTVISTRQKIRQSLARLCTAMGGGYEVK
ncbi:MAG: efflux transporter outer membrane subunit [Akkermansia sp.]